MELCRSREAAICADIQEFRSISWNPKVPYRFHKSPPLVPILSHINPVHITSSYLCKILSNIIQTLNDLVSLVALPPVFYIRATCPAHLILLVLIILIILFEE
jgi:hypothetical protein